MIYSEKTFGKKSFWEYCRNHSTEDELKKWVPKKLESKAFEKFCEYVKQLSKYDYFWPEDYPERYLNEMVSGSIHDGEAGMDSLPWKFLVTGYQGHIFSYDNDKKRYFKTMLDSYVKDRQLYERSDRRFCDSELDINIHIQKSAYAETEEPIYVVIYTIKNMCDHVLKFNKEKKNCYIKVNGRKFARDKYIEEGLFDFEEIKPLESKTVEEAFRLRDIGIINTDWRIELFFSESESHKDYYYEYACNEIREEAWLYCLYLRSFETSPVPKKKHYILKDENKKIKRDKSKEEKLGFGLKYMSVSIESEYDIKYVIRGEFKADKKSLVPKLFSIIISLLDSHYEMIDYGQIDGKRIDVINEIPFKYEFKGIDPKEVSEIRIKYCVLEK